LVSLIFLYCFSGLFFLFWRYWGLNLASCLLRRVLYLNHASSSTSFLFHWHSLRSLFQLSASFTFHWFFFFYILKWHLLSWY
jgi:hypothetical protein